MKDLNVFGSAMPHEELVEDGGRIRRRAVFAVSDEELEKKAMDESEEEAMFYGGEEKESEE